MSKIPRTCFLIPRVFGRDQIQLPHEENVIIDCGEIFPDVTEIALLKLYAMANCNSGFVIIQSMGLVPCRHKGRVLTRGAKYLFGPGNMIQLNGVMWEYEYEVGFNPPMPEYVLHLDLPRLIERTIVDPQSITNYAPSTWQEYDEGKLLVYTPYLLNHSAGIAGFSLEDVLAKKDTWVLKYDNVAKGLKKWYDKKYKIAVFINQGVAKKLGTKKACKENIAKLLRQFNVPVQVFISFGEMKYKKPVPYMWHVMAESFNKHLIIEPDRCCYIGSSSDLTDRLFAINIGIRFFSSGEYFKRRIPMSSPEMPDFNPKQQMNEIVCTLTVSAIQEVVVMVGRPCSGRTFICNNYLRCYHYCYTSGPIQHTITQLIKFLKTTKRSVVIDGRHPSRELRMKYIEIANTFNVPCRCFVMDVSRAQARHIHKLREIITKKTKPNFNELLNAFDAQYEAPKLNEGFSQIVYVPFVPCYITDEEKRLYRYYLLAD